MSDATSSQAASSHAAALAREHQVALTMAADWLGQRFFRTFRPSDGDPAPFDARLRQRDRAVGVTLATLWDTEVPRSPAVTALESLVSADLAERGDTGSYVLWLPPGVTLPPDEPQRSEMRLLIGRGLQGLAQAERREIRVPVVLRLAKIEPTGEYVMVSGGLSSQWTRISEGIVGVYHLDAREVHRLPEEPAELDIILARIRDRAVLLDPQEVTDVHVHDYWVVSRLSVEEPAGLTIVAAPPSTSVDAESEDGTRVRRGLRRAARRAAQQRQGAPDVEFSVLVLLDAIGHIEQELATQSLRGMSPASYGDIDQILLVADGRVREILQPRSVPWSA